MVRSKGEDAAALRQLMARTEQARERPLRVLFSTRQRMVRGSFVVLGKKCGKAGCVCRRGQLHPTRYLWASEQGRTRMVYVSAAQAAAVKAGAERYQRFRRARAELVKLSARTVALADRLQQALTDALAVTVAGQKEEGGGGEGRTSSGGRASHRR